MVNVSPNKKTGKRIFGQSVPVLLIICTIFCSTKISAQQIIPLYPDSIPNATGYKMTEIQMKSKEKVVGLRSISDPSVSVYMPLAGTATGTAVIVCPGGGYAMESVSAEGSLVAETLIKHGITVFVLKYRLPSDSILRDKSIGPLQDAQQAIKLVRQRANEWKLDPNKIGIMGFSAGGHLASTAATHFKTSYIPNAEAISLRPDFAILIYPVISFTEELAHKGSRELLLGKNPSAEQIKLFSNELQVTAETPPTWLTHAGDDKVVIVENSIRFYEALLKNRVPVEMHLYPKGNHGFVLSQPYEEWMQPLFRWMQKNGWVKE